ncbi:MULTISPECIES: plastocyanin/azurin family copper-binding protein [unclassified Pseudovibrio]|uniref:plastocyanin/azurin family copper-binding protein n=1 Tax=unclassified Pseudovibrio TaxID=2627060 RepID=UPI0007AE5426|nr:MULTISPECIES: plastocyanin/azurin family copper-binding protein [unclassified Pseudovibrio]KZL05967.1 Pseudoazurin precursor [Pseudovibrio sp. Ad26]KZL22388.1 Pseudoazurin precursor [Pseudovibrio sp. WM33]
MKTVAPCKIKKHETIFMNKRSTLVLMPALVSFLLSVTGSNAGAIHTIRMDRDFFSPAYLEAQVGDTVRFVNVRGTHNTVSISGMIPAGVSPWRSRLKATYDLTLTKEGVYGYKCLPHFGKGMVGLIAVGKQYNNLPQAKSTKLPAKAAAVFQKLFRRVPQN